MEFSCSDYLSPVSASRNNNIDIEKSALGFQKAVVCISLNPTFFLESFL
jgi:hypothetical protein